MEADRSSRAASVDVEIRGLSIYTHHGVTEAEQEIGQRLEIDVSFDVPDCDAVLTDRLEDTVDYAEVCDIVALGATERSYKTLERLCHVIAERLMERFACESVRVRAAKPEPPLPIAVEQVAVEVVHVREDSEVGGRGRRRRVTARVSGTWGWARTSAIASRICGPRSQDCASMGSRSMRFRRRMRPSRSARCSTSRTS